MHIDRFITYLEDTDKSPRTINGYNRDLQTFIAWYEGSTGQPPSAATVTPLDIREYRQYLSVTKRLKPASVNRKLSALRAYFNWARQAKLVSTSPVAGVKDVKQVARAPRWLNRKQVYALLNAATAAIQVAEARGLSASAATAKRNAAILSLLLNAGLRVSELCALRLDDVTINDRSGLVVVRSGKGGKYREVPLNKDVRQKLRDWLAVRQSDGEYLFFGRRGDVLKPRGVQRVISDLAAAARLDIGTVTPHALRHTFGKNLVDAGTPLDRVAMLMGHSNLNTTAIYTRPSGADLAAAVDRIAWAD